MDSARQDGLPVEPLVQKALEGASKGAPNDVIVDAVRALHTRLRRASTALGDGASNSELVAAAGALYVGVPSGTLEDLAQSRSEESLSVSLVVLTDLIRRGVNRDTAADVVRSLVRARVDEDGMARFRKQVERDISSGASPGTAATSRARGMLLQRRVPPSPGVPDKVT